MAVPMTYDSLKLQMQQYANRFDEFFINNLPDLINLAINRIYCEAKNIGFERVADSTQGFSKITSNNPFFAKPADWKETISFEYFTLNSDSGFLLPRSYEFCKTYWPDANSSLLPKFYADYGNQSFDLGNQGKSFDYFYIAPTPIEDYEVRIIYLGLPIFNEANQVNFLTQKYPNLLLYACMVEAIILIGSDERLQMFESLYNRALQNINQDTVKRYTDRTTTKEKD